MQIVCHHNMTLVFENNNVKIYKGVITAVAEPLVTLYGDDFLCLFNAMRIYYGLDKSIN